MRYSVGTEAAYLVFALIIGVLAYFAAERFKRSHGVTPWRWPAAVWGIIGFLSLLLCVVLFLIAQRTTRLPSVSATVPAAPAGGPPPGWFPDPSGRYERRYWDGSGWTAQVATGETVTSDPA